MRPDTPTREQLPDRRAAINFGFTFKNVDFDVTVGFHPDGRPGEVFVHGLKAGSDLQNTLVDAGIALSIAMQNGLGLEPLRKAFARDESGEPSSVLGMLVERVSAVLEGLARAPEPLPLALPAPPTAAPSAPRAQGYTGDTCAHCQNATLIRAGTCMRCETCGETTGCS